MAKVCYYTTLDSVGDVGKYQWKRVINIKKQCEYDGIAWLYREANIPILRKDLGTTDDLSWSLFTTPDENNNLGVDILVPQECFVEACKLVENSEHIKEAAVLESKRAKTYEKEYELAHHRKPYLFSAKEYVRDDHIVPERVENSFSNKVKGYLFYVILVLVVVNLVVYGILH
jgi:hypothetical protein